MKNIIKYFILFILIFNALFFREIPITNAQPNIIYVPEDFESVFEAVENASEGDTVFVKCGKYDGPINQTLVINKSISLVGEDKQATILYFIPPLVQVTIFTQTFWVRSSPIHIDANNVTLSGFNIDTIDGPHPSSIKSQITVNGNNNKIVDNNIFTGINLYGSHSVITKNNITGRLYVEGSNQDIANNVLIDGNDFGIQYIGSHSNITSNYVYGSGGGIYVGGSFNVVWENDLATDSSIRVGLDLSGNGNVVAYNNLTDGMGVGGSDNIVYGNRLVKGEQFRGFVLVGYNNTFHSNYAAGAVLGSRKKDAYDNKFYHNNFLGETPIEIGEGVYGPNFWDNGKEGNYWSAYNITDNDGDGIGDMPYIIDEANQDNYPLINQVDTNTIPEFSSEKLFYIFIVVTLLLVIYRKFIS